jgi:hypothetical protein
MLPEFDAMVADLLSHENEVFERVLGAVGGSAAVFSPGGRSEVEKSVVRAFAALAGAMVTLPATDLVDQALARLGESMDLVLQAGRPASREAGSAGSGSAGGSS